MAHTLASGGTSEIASYHSRSRSLDQTTSGAIDEECPDPEVRITRTQTLHRNPRPKSTYDPDTQMSPAPTSPSDWEARAKVLRDEINREHLSLKRLEALAEDLPKLKRQSESRQQDSGHHHNAKDSRRRSSSNRQSEDLHSTSRVIENLQATADMLKRDLHAQREMARQETSSREALGKRCEILESTNDTLKRQVDMLTRLLERKERRIEELEGTIETKNDKIERLEQDVRAHDTCKLRQEHLEAEISRLETAYSAVLESARRVKDRCTSDISAIAEKISNLENERQRDGERAGLLATKVAEQAAERERLAKLQGHAAELRQKNLRQIEAAFADMKKEIADSDSGMTRKVNNALRAIDALERQYIQLSKTQKHA